MRPKFGTFLRGCWEAKMLNGKLSFRNYAAEEGFQQSPQLREHSLEKRCVRERKTLEDDPVHLWSRRVHCPKCSHQPETENRSPNLRPSFKRTNSLIAMRWTAHILSASQKQKQMLTGRRKNHSEPLTTSIIFHTENLAHNKNIPLQTHWKSYN